MGAFHPITPGLRIPSLAPRESFGLGLDRTLILGLLILRNGVMTAFVGSREGTGEVVGGSRGVSTTNIPSALSSSRDTGSISVSELSRELGNDMLRAHEHSTHCMKNSYCAPTLLPGPNSSGRHARPEGLTVNFHTLQSLGPTPIPGLS